MKERGTEKLKKKGRKGIGIEAKKKMKKRKENQLLRADLRRVPKEGVLVDNWETGEKENSISFGILSIKLINSTFSSSEE